jgi:hypothetical protein
MPEYCTCGTQLVENARFCHRCGRPASEAAEAEAMAEETVPAALQPPPLPTAASAQVKAAALPVSFSNPIALRVAFLMALAIIPIEMAPVLNMLAMVWWLGAGWCAVLLYRRLTGLVLSVRAGARLGSITGILTFVTMIVSLTLTLALGGTKEFFDQMDEQAKQMAQQMGQSGAAALQTAMSPMGRFFSLIAGMALVGLLVVGICAAGGALGARFAARKANG